MCWSMALWPWLAANPMLIQCNDLKCLLFYCDTMDTMLHHVVTNSFHVGPIPSESILLPIGHVNEYPTMHYFGIPRHTQSMIANKILTEYFWKFSEKFHCGNVVNMP